MVDPRSGLALNACKSPSSCVSCRRFEASSTNTWSRETMQQQTMCNYVQLLQRHPAPRFVALKKSSKFHTHLLDGDNFHGGQMDSPVNNASRPSTKLLKSNLPCPSGSVKVR